MDYKEKYESCLECIQEILSGAGHETYRKDICEKCGKVNVKYIDDED